MIYFKRIIYVIVWILFSPLFLLSIMVWLYVGLFIYSPIIYIKTGKNWLMESDWKFPHFISTIPDRIIKQK